MKPVVTAHGEPTIRGARVRDREGDTWQLATTWWTCLTRHVPNQRWPELQKRHGPVLIIDLNEGKRS